MTTLPPVTLAGITYAVVELDPKQFSLKANAGGVAIGIVEISLWMWLKRVLAPQPYAVVKVMVNDEFRHYIARHDHHWLFSGAVHPLSCYTAELFAHASEDVSETIFVMERLRKLHLLTDSGDI